MRTMGSSRMSTDLLSAVSYDGDDVLMDDVEDLDVEDSPDPEVELEEDDSPSAPGLVRLPLRFLLSVTVNLGKYISLLFSR